MNKKAFVNKAEWFAAWIMSNAIRLHYDAIILFKKRSYASALGLSILSMEEIAKAHLIDDLVFNANVNDWTPESWNEIRKIFLSHRWKQTLFASRLFPFYQWRKVNGRLKAHHFVELCETGTLEKMKQNSLYAGLSGKTFMKSRIVNPFKVPRSKPARMITLVNDYFLDLSVGCIIGYYGLDSDFTMGMLKPRFVRQLKLDWRFRGRKGIVALRRFRRLAAG